MLMARRPNFYEIRYPPHHFSLKTVPRTVFLTLEPKGSNPLFLQVQKKNPSVWMGFLLEATIGFEPMNQGFADPRLTTWLCRHIDFLEKNRTQETGRILCPVFMERMTRLELATSTLARWRSTR